MKVSDALYLKSFFFLITCFGFFLLFQFKEEDEDLKCTESIEEEEQTGEDVNTDHSVNGDNHRRSRRNVDRRARRKGKEKIRSRESMEDDGVLIGDEFDEELSQSEEGGEYDRGEYEDEDEEEEGEGDEEEEEEYDEDGYDLRFFERIGDTARELLTSIEEQRKENREERQINLLQRGYVYFFWEGGYSSTHC